MKENEDFLTDGGENMIEHGNERQRHKGNGSARE